jgi:hypothetical protein
MKRSTLRAALMFTMLTAPLWGSSSRADDAHHPVQAAPGETQAAPPPSAPSAQGQTQPGQTPSGMMMNCPMMQSGQGHGGMMNCPMMTPGQTQGMGSGMMQEMGPGQMQPGQMGPGQMSPGQQHPPTGNQ